MAGSRWLVASALVLGGGVLSAAVAPAQTTRAFLPARSAEDHPCLVASQHGTPKPLNKDLPADLRADSLFDAYMAADEQVLVRALATDARFEQFRADFRNRVLPKWVIDPWQPGRAVFMLDVAIVALGRNFRYWLDFIEQGRRFVIGRAVPPGQDTAADAFEIAWHKASVAVLSGIRRPDYVAECGVDPLDDRMAPSASPIVPRLIDPWIELARGYRAEGFTITEPGSLASRGASALGHYANASQHEATRGEAIVRRAWLLIRMGRAAEALDVIEGFDERWAPAPAVLYWSRLFRARALAELGRLDDAAREYERALAVVPDAQTPKVGLMTVELARGGNEAAYKWAAATRTGPETASDPFWLYAFGDRRFLPARLTALRALVRR